MVTVRRCSSAAVPVLGLTLVFWGVFLRSHEYWLRDFGEIIILMSLGFSLPRVRVEVSAYLSMLKKLRRLCECTGVPFGLGNSALRRLFPFMLTTLALSMAFLFADMILRANSLLLHVLSDAFQILSALGIGLFLTRDRSVARILSKIEALPRDGKFVASPPRTASFILLLIPKRHREFLLGDIEEEFATKVVPQYGTTVGALWYWWHVLISIWPFLWALAKRIAAFVVIWRGLR